MPGKPVVADQRVTLRTLRRWVREGRPFPVLTCYDATTAGLLWRGGVKCLLVGDTAAQVILGHDSTLPAPMPFMLEITAAVRRGARDAFVIADMPFGSYQCGDDEAMRHAADFLRTAGADAVKLEVDASFAPLVGRMASAGVPVVAHIGSRPQTVRARGGYGSVARTPAEIDELVRTAKLMVDAGASLLLIEAVPAEASAAVVEATRSAAHPGPTGNSSDSPVPIIGCGAGPACHGHVVVIHDLLGLSDWQPPFAPPVTDLALQIEKAAGKWATLVESGRYLRRDHPYHMRGM